MHDAISSHTADGTAVPPFKTIGLQKNLWKHCKCKRDIIELIELLLHVLHIQKQILRHLSNSLAWREVSNACHISLCMSSYQVLHANRSDVTACDCQWRCTDLCNVFPIASMQLFPGHLHSCTFRYFSGARGAKAQTGRLRLTSCSQRVNLVSFARHSVCWLLLFPAPVASSSDQHSFWESSSPRKGWPPSERRPAPPDFSYTEETLRLVLDTSTSGEQDTFSEVCAVTADKCCLEKALRSSGKRGKPPLHPVGSLIKSEQVSLTSQC